MIPGNAKPFNLIIPILAAIACMAFLNADLLWRAAAALASAFALGMLLNRRMEECASCTAVFRQVFNFSPDYALIARLPEGTIIDANAAFERMTGISREDAIGKTTLELGLWEDPTQRPHLFEAMQRQQLPLHDVPGRMVRPDGKRLDVLMSVSTLAMNGEKMLIAVVRDVTEQLATQRRLEASESRLKAIFDASPAPIVLNRISDFVIVGVNPAWETLYGLKSASVTGKTLAQIGIRAVNGNALRTQTGLLLESGRIDGAEIEFLTPNHHHVSIIYSSRVIDLDGEQVMISINTDVTRLRETENRLRAIVEAAPFPIAIMRLTDWCYLQVNEKFERMVHMPAKAVVGKRLGEVGFIAVHPEVLRAQTESLVANGQIDNALFEAIDPDGKRKTFQYSSRIIELNGEPAVITIASDISQLKEVEAGLRLAEAARIESEARFAALFESSPIALGVYRDNSGEFTATQLNQAWFQTFGFPPERILGHTTAEIDMWFDANQRQRVLDIAQQHGEVRNFECWLQRADGSRILCSLSCRVIEVGGQRMMLVAYLDITQQYETEQRIRQLNAELVLSIDERTHQLQVAQAELMRAEKMVSLGSLVAGIAHELNTPIGNSLTVATTLAEHCREMRTTMRDGLRRSTLETYISDTESGSEILSRNLQRASQLIQSFKSIAVDQASDSRRSFDLHQVMQETVAALQPSLKRKPYKIRLQVEEGLTLNSYPGSLEQVVVNLINNAVLHGFDGREHGEIEIRGEAGADDQIRLCIRDDGAGIAPDNLARIFDPFFTTKMGKGGSGLGLHIVRSIVEKTLGGSIHASSESGKGTCMEITLPRLAPDTVTDAEP